MTYYCTYSLIINHEVPKARVTASVNLIRRSIAKLIGSEEGWLQVHIFHHVNPSLPWLSENYIGPSIIIFNSKFLTEGLVWKKAQARSGKNNKKSINRFAKQYRKPSGGISSSTTIFQRDGRLLEALGTSLGTSTVTS
jgi:hypothetical protein